MKSIIICEGYTDLALIQYFMETVNGWKYDDFSRKVFSFNTMKEFKKGENSLILGETGGCGNIEKSFRLILQANSLEAYDNETYENIVIICDRDEVGTVEDFIGAISTCKTDFNVECSNDIENNVWLNCSMKNIRDNNVDFRLLLMIIPFEETGALETFLLNAISDYEPYDGNIIEKGNDFVDNADSEKRYLSKRRYVTKAKFDVYFSIRTPLEQFGQRRDILRNVNWEEYETVQECFVKLKELG